MMTPMRQAYLDTAASAAALLADPAVAAAWEAPSALPRFRVSGLAGHLGRQITDVARLLAETAPAGNPITLLDHYARVEWIGASLDADVNINIRRAGSKEAAGGPAALTALAGATLRELCNTLPSEPADRIVYLPGRSWSLSLDDFLASRMLEIAVHCDDLAVSVSVPGPHLPETALETVLTLLIRLAVRKHGPTAVLRSLSRAERAPATIAAI